MESKFGSELTCKKSVNKRFKYFKCQYPLWRSPQKIKTTQERVPSGIIFATEARRKYKMKTYTFPWDYKRKRLTSEIRMCCKRLHQFLVSGLRGIRVFHLKQSPKHGRMSTTIKYITTLWQDKGFAVRFLTLWSWISWRESFFALPSYVPYPWLSKENMTMKHLHLAYLFLCLSGYHCVFQNIAKTK